MTLHKRTNTEPHYKAARILQCQHCALTRSAAQCNPHTVQYRRVQNRTRTSSQHTQPTCVALHSTVQYLLYSPVLSSLTCRSNFLQCSASRAVFYFTHADSLQFIRYLQRSTAHTSCTVLLPYPQILARLHRNTHPFCSLTITGTRFAPLCDYKDALCAPCWPWQIQHPSVPQK